jgi:predicted transcriptional regulator
MEELTIELDDEIVAWLESTAAAQRKTVSDVVQELIAEIRGSPRTVERSPG